VCCPELPASRPRHSFTVSRRNSLSSAFALVFPCGLCYSSSVSSAPTDKPVVVVRGTLPVILACGHDGNVALPSLPLRQPYPNPKRSLPIFSVQRDVKTGSLTLEIAEVLTASLDESPFIVFSNFARAIVDVNRQREYAFQGSAGLEAWSGYHDLLDAATEDIEQGLLLDIHGTSLGGADVYFGTRNGVTCAPAVVTTFASTLTGMGYRVVLNHPRLSGGYTVWAHGAASNGLDAIQVEVAKPLRTDDSRRMQLARDLADVVAVLVGTYRSARPH
jgi:hypothetical protein